MAPFKPRYITFDCYGTLINFEMGPAARRAYGGRVRQDRMDAFVEDFSRFRLDEVLGAWKPYRDVVADALARTCALHGVPHSDADVAAVYGEIPNWNPHPDVPQALARVGAAFKLVGLTNSMVDLIPASIPKLGAPFHKVITAEETGAYKPQRKGFEHMLKVLDCGPEDVMHCSSSFRYDLMTAYDMGFGARVFVNRGHEPANPFYSTHEIAGIDGLPALLGLA